MFLIIDNNVTHCCVAPKDEDGLAIIEWVRTHGKIVAGGGLLREYVHPDRGNMRFVRLFNALAAAGRAVRWQDGDIDARTNILIASGELRSNDAHVIALAQVSGARALWSRDQDLRQDFRNPAVISNPRGKMYFPEGSARRRQVGLAAISSVCHKS